MRDAPQPDFVDLSTSSVVWIIWRFGTSGVLLSLDGHTYPNRLIPLALYKVSYGSPTDDYKSYNGYQYSLMHPITLASINKLIEGARICQYGSVWVIESGTPWH